LLTANYISRRLFKCTACGFVLYYYVFLSVYGFAML
jgi:hypothetical protein